ncbi:hypothetical protein L596_011093 [Steinernema carpocapsae]|uniref:IGFBP N-terminal domain-containing protein n=1 Tax=Steinernema carpocapsae TaxID=34508 RepID=A0A4U5NTB5_STECR|nr:hypothetical protein L596_011093 [Steinernema carpocapsae]
MRSIVLLSALCFASSCAFFFPPLGGADVCSCQPAASVCPPAPACPVPPPAPVCPPPPSCRGCSGPSCEAPQAPCAGNSCGGIVSGCSGGPASGCGEFSQPQFPSFSIQQPQPNLPPAAPALAPVQSPQSLQQQYQQAAPQQYQQPVQPQPQLQPVTQPQPVQQQQYQHSPPLQQNQPVAVEASPLRAEGYSSGEYVHSPVPAGHNAAGEKLQEVVEEAESNTLTMEFFEKVSSNETISHEVSEAIPLSELKITEDPLCNNEDLRKLMIDI